MWGVARRLTLSDDKIEKICDTNRPVIAATISRQLKDSPTESNRVMNSVRDQFKSIVRDAAHGATLLLS